MKNFNIGNTIVLLLGVIFTLIVTLYGHMWWGLLPLAAVISLQLISHIRNLIYLIIFAIFSRLFIGKTVGGQPAWFLLELLLVGALVLRMALHRLQFKKMTPTQYSVIGMIALLFITAQQTGFGLYLFGMGSKNAIGGMIYIKCFLNMILFILLTRLDFGIDLRKAIYAMMAGAICLFAMEFSVIFLHQYWIANWFQPITSDLSMEGISALSHGATLAMARFRSTLFVAWALAFFMYFKKGLKFFGVIVTMVIISAFSGYRSDFIATIGFIIVCYFFIVRRALLFWKSVLPVTIVGVFMLYIALPIMPPSVQRTGSMIFPNRVSTLVKESASSSNLMRLEIYKYTISQMHRYVWIGRGLTDSLDEKLALIYSRSKGSEHYFNAHAYHLGIFNILIDGGILFAMAFAIFLVMMFRRFLRLNKSTRTIEATFLACWFFSYMFYLLFIGEAPFRRMEIWMMAATMLYLALEKKESQVAEAK